MTFISDSTRKKQSGMTLLEALIAFLVLSVGLLGMAGLQLTGMKMTNDSYYRSQATWLAYDMFDRMRANKDQATNTTSYRIAYDETPSSATDCSAASCNALAMAQYDLKYWRDDITAKLPAGTGEISYQDTGSGRVFTVAIQWHDVERRDEGDRNVITKRLQIVSGL